MTMDWDNYQIIDLPIDLKSRLSSQFGELSRAAAERIFSELMDKKEKRKEMLDELIRANGLRLSCGEEDLLALNDWMFRNASCREDDIHDVPPIWYSVSIDVSLFLGDCMIESEPNLRWALCTDPPDNAVYHMPVIVGFQNCEEEFEVGLMRPVSGIPRRSLPYHYPEQKIEVASNLAKPSYYRRLKRYKAREKAGEPLDRTLVKISGNLEYA